MVERFDKLWVNQARIREHNNRWAIDLEEPGLLGKYYGRVEPSYPRSSVQKGTVPLRINIKESSQQ